MMTSQVMTVDEIRKSRQPAETAVGLTNAAGFELTMRIANMLTNSTMVPEQFRKMIPDKKQEKLKDNTYPLVENPSGLPNCIIALNMAERMKADPLMIMQNLYLVEGRPSWSSQFIVAAINSCGRYSSLRFDIQDKGEKELDYNVRTWEWNERAKKKLPVDTTHTARIQNIVCIAWAIELETGHRLESSPISMEMAVKEGWYQKNGSKWQTMPEQMLRYRAASFFGRIYAPELLMGLRSQDEELDRVIDITPQQIDDVAEQITEKAEQAAKEPRNVKRRAPKEAETVVEEVAQSMPDVSVAAIRQEIEKAQDIDSLNSIFGSRVEPFTGRMTEKQREDLNAAYEAAEYRIQNTAEQEPEPEYVEQPRQQPRQQQRQAQQQPDDHFDFE